MLFWALVALCNVSSGALEAEPPLMAAASASTGDRAELRVLFFAEGYAAQSTISNVTTTLKGASVRWILPSSTASELRRWRAKPTRKRGRRRLRTALRDRMREQNAQAAIYTYAWRRRGVVRTWVVAVTSESFSEILLKVPSRRNTVHAQRTFKDTVMKAVEEALHTIVQQMPTLRPVPTSKENLSGVASSAVTAETMVDMSENERTPPAFFVRTTAGVVGRRFVFSRPAAPSLRDHNIPALFVVGFSAAAFPLFGAELTPLARIGWFGEATLSVGGRSVFVGDETAVLAPTTLGSWGAGLRLRDIVGDMRSRFGLGVDIGVGQDSTAFSLDDGDPRLNVVPDTAYTHALLGVYIRASLPWGMGVGARAAYLPTLSGGRVADRLLRPAKVVGVHAEATLYIPTLVFDDLTLVLLGTYRNYRYSVQGGATSFSSGASDLYYSAQMGLRYAPNSDG